MPLKTLIANKDSSTFATKLCQTASFGPCRFVRLRTWNDVMAGLHQQKWHYKFYSADFQHDSVHCSSTSFCVHNLFSMSFLLADTPASATLRNVHINY